jgi:long-chain-fatty-acid--CoA ligase ACSBG
MGFNCPEWTIAFMGGVLNNCIGTGIYATNAQEACMYQVDHAEAEIIVCETNDHLKRFDASKLPRVKAFVVFGEKELPKDIKDSRYYLWQDFMKVGADIKESVILEKVSRQRPGECVSLIYTSGTTGMPKGVMLSHDNLCWIAIPMMLNAQKSDPSIPVNQHRVVSYLPLSHVAGLCVDIMSHVYAGHELYFAMPDALAGTLVITLTWARPTIFFAVPRVWEKFEDKLKEIGASKPQFLQNLSSWAKGYGAQKVKLQ